MIANKPILVLSTIKSEDYYLSPRFDRAKKEKKELLSNLLLINDNYIKKLNLEKIIIINSNYQKITSQDIDNLLAPIKGADQIILFDLLSKAEIINSNNYRCDSDDIVKIMNGLNSNIILVEELLDKYLLFLLIHYPNMPKVDSIIRLNYHIVRNNIKKYIIESLHKNSDNESKLESLDENKYYEKYIIELVELKGLKQYTDFLKNQKTGYFFYIYGEDEQLLESLKCKTIKSLKEKAVVLQNFNPTTDNLVIEDFILISLFPSIDPQNLLPKINELITAGHSILIFDSSSIPRIHDNKVYIPNYNELKNYHWDFFKYFLINRVFSEDILKRINSLKSPHDFIEKLNSLKSVEELENYVDLIDINKIKKLNDVNLEKYLLENIQNYLPNIIEKQNKIYYEDGEWCILFSGTIYQPAFRTISIELKILLEMLSGNHEYPLSEFGKKINESILNDNYGAEALRSALNRAITKIKNEEKSLKIKSLFSDYLKSAIKIKKDKYSDAYKIKSINLSEKEWIIDKPNY